MNNGIITLSVSTADPYFHFQQLVFLRLGYWTHLKGHPHTSVRAVEWNIWARVSLWKALFSCNLLFVVDFFLSWQSPIFTDSKNISTKQQQKTLIVRTNEGQRTPTVALCRVHSTFLESQNTLNLNLKTALKQKQLSGNVFKSCHLNDPNSLLNNC